MNSLFIFNYQNISLRNVNFSKFTQTFNAFSLQKLSILLNFTYIMVFFTIAKKSFRLTICMPSLGLVLFHLLSIVPYLLGENPNICQGLRTNFFILEDKSFHKKFYFCKCDIKCHQTYVLQNWFVQSTFDGQTEFLFMAKRNSNFRTARRRDEG